MDTIPECRAWRKSAHRGVFFTTRFNLQITVTAMLERFTETTGRQRLAFGLVGIAINLLLLFLGGIVWFWLWAVSIALLLFSSFSRRDDTG